MQTNGRIWPDAYSVEFLGFGDRYGRRRLPPRSLTHLERSITEHRWVGSRGMDGGPRLPERNTSKPASEATSEAGLSSGHGSL